MWGVAYLVWRVVATGGGVSRSTWFVLLVAEAAGLLVFGSRAWLAWPGSGPPRVGPDTPPVTIVVEATGEPVADLRTTLVAARAMAGRPRPVVVDQCGNRWLRTVAERSGATVLDRHQDLHTAVAGVPTEWVLVLRPGDEPDEDLVERVAPFCTDELAVVQLAIAESGPEPWDEGLRPDSPVDAFDRQVIRPALGARTSMPWFGDGPALVRPAVIHSIRCTSEPATGAARVADRWWNAGIALTEAGLRIGATAAAPVKVRTSPTIEERSTLRREVTSRRLRTLGSAVRPSRLGWRPAAAHATVAVVPVMAAGSRVLQATVLVLVLGLGQTPLAASAVGLIGFAVPAYGLRWLAHLLLGQGRLRPFDLLHDELRSIGPDLASLLPPTDHGRSPGRWVLGALTALVAVSLVVGVVATWADFGDRPPGSIVAATIGLSAAFVGLAVGVIVDACSAVQRRRHRRVRLGMVTCRVEEHEGFLVDISTGGVSVALPGAGSKGPVPGAHTTLAFRVPTVTGRWRAVSSIVHVVRSAPDDEGGVRLGLEFDDPTAAPLDAVAEFLAADPARPPGSGTSTVSVDPVREGGR